MIDDVHLLLLKKDVEEWNEWRDENLQEDQFNLLNFYGHTFKGMNLAKVNFALTYLSEADFEEAVLDTANFNSANLSYANFKGASLKNVDFFSADLSDANLSGADLSNADFSHANLFGAMLNGANLENTTFGETNLSNTDLTDIKGLSSCRHLWPSGIDWRTFARSGMLPLAFLRGCGMPEILIEYFSSLLINPIQFYACFISFTEADNAFSERLYNDLQVKGVRCWRWKEDAKLGKTLMRSIDEAVRLYDKLIIICSEQSLNSPAVIREIERALQKEDEQARQGKEAEVLFPIRLDDYIFNGWNHHRKADVIAKNVGDFKKWDEPEQYKKAFDRLLRDLKAGE